MEYYITNLKYVEVPMVVLLDENISSTSKLLMGFITTLTMQKESFDIRVENTKLKEENEILKQKMDALLTFIKDHKEKNDSEEIKLQENF